MLWEIFGWWMITAVATGLWIIPFFVVKDINQKRIWYGNAIAAWLMLTASFGMIFEWIHGSEYNVYMTFLWLMLGMVFILLSEKYLSNNDIDIIWNNSINAKKVLLIIAVMTAHSFAEWIAIGVSFGPSVTFGLTMSIALALHNIPEWLAIWLTSIPRWMSKRKAVWWSIFTSLPQPFMAVLAYIFVKQFEGLLPVWLGFAAGAMIWLAFSELLPEAMNEISNQMMATILTVSIWLMVVFINIIG